MTKVIKISDENHEYLASLCTTKGESFNDALDKVIKVAKRYKQVLAGA